MQGRRAHVATTCVPISQQPLPGLPREGQWKRSGRGRERLQPKWQDLEGSSHQDGLQPKVPVRGQLHRGSGGDSASWTRVEANECTELGHQGPPAWVCPKAI